MGVIMDSPVLLLNVTPAESAPFEHLVDGDEAVIGRSTRCHVTVADRFMSRRHARLFKVGDDWQVEDLGSRNGTFVNGRPVEGATAVGVGDVITLSASLVKIARPVDRERAPGAASEAPSTDHMLRPAVELLRRSETPPGDDASFGRYASRLALINEVHKAMARSVSVEELLELILDHVFAQLEPHRAEVFMRCDGGGYACMARRMAPHTDLGSLESESLFAEVVDKSMAALVTDARADRRFADAASLVSAGVRSLLAAPLVAPPGALGLIVLGSNAAVRQFTEEDLELLVTLASVAAMRIHNLALTEEAAERRRLERELTIARRLQVDLIPQRLPEVAGYRLWGATRPSRGVSGDYYQLVERSGGDEVVLALADVSGKGIAAALLTGYLEAVSSVPIEDGLAPHEILNRISPKLHQRTPANRFATMFLGVISPSAPIFRFASAGHAPACLVRLSGEVEWLGATGIPLGLLPSADYRLGEATIENGDTLVVYSDGYTEAEGRDGEEFGQHRLAEVCREHRRCRPEALAEAVDRALEGFAAGRPFADDRTIVVVRREG